MSVHVILHFDTEDEAIKFCFYVDSYARVLIENEELEEISANYLEKRECDCKPLVSDD